MIILTLTPKLYHLDQEIYDGAITSKRKIGGETIYFISTSWHQVQIEPSHNASCHLQMI